MEQQDILVNSGDGQESGERKNEYRAYVRRLCSVLGFALFLLFFGIQAVGLALSFFSAYLASHSVMGLGADIYRMLHSGWFSVAGSSLLAYALILPLVERVLEKVPEVRPEPKHMRRGKFFSFLVFSMGAGYIFNFAGNFINVLLASLTKRSFYQMTPVSSLVSDMNWVTAVYVGFIAPVIEEYIFRGLILNRLRPLGDKAAIIFSAVMFGLMHGNVTQFLYAAALGVIFGYIAVKTGRIFYTGALHIFVNSYTTFFVLGVARSSAFYGLAALLGTMLIGAATLGFIVAAIVIFAVNSKKTKLKRGNWPEGVEYRDFSLAMYLNPALPHSEPSAPPR